jgi:hypothetical protein
MLKKRILTLGVGAIAFVALVAGPAAARSDTTITETCTSGTVLTVDHNATGGLTTAENHYNVVNPTGDVCTIN